MLTTAPESRPASSGNPIAGHRLRADVWLPGDVALMVRTMMERAGMIHVEAEQMAIDAALERWQRERQEFPTLHTKLLATPEALPSAPISLPENLAEEPLVIGKEGSNFKGHITRSGGMWQWFGTIKIYMHGRSWAHEGPFNSRREAIEELAATVSVWIFDQHFVHPDCIRAAREVEAMLAAAEGESK